MLQSKVSHCPGCQKPVLTEGQFTAPMSFRIRCPHCQKNVRVEVQFKITTRLETDLLPIMNLRDIQ